MKVFLASLLSGLVTAAGISSASAQTPPHFRGVACIISTSTGCEPVGWSPGNCATARFTPPNYGGSGNMTRLSLFWGSFFGQNFQGPGSFIGTTFKDVTATSIGNSGSTYPAQMRIPSQSPANPTNAIFLQAVADIGGFDFEPSCRVRVRFSGTRIPVTGPSAQPAAAGEEFLSELPLENAPAPSETGMANRGASFLQSSE